MGKQSGNGERFMGTRAQCYDTTRSYTKPLPRTRRTLEAEGLCLFTGVYDTITDLHVLAQRKSTGFLFVLKQLHLQKYFKNPHATDQN